MRLDELLDQHAERLRRQETSERRPTMWEVWFVAGTIQNPLQVGQIHTPSRIYNLTGRTLTITEVFLSVDTLVGAQDIIVDVNMDGSTIFALLVDRPRILIGANTGTAAPTGTPEWPDGSYLTVDLDQVDLLGTAANLTVQVVYYA